ncbi:ankyrin repeat domain containing protein, putative [Entamoeba invadens IP1]|uniref:ankyrin repeat domain containing protein, putative n=1 Tax=Entamoeba invadens IP1 TaxID=370355 RepID=UPI0002C3F07D|nr:ankyrin repeat domain containing protein, putative [Entamoeba invadens IP1]ELP93097.1 ankyrin repeat domain containing protein, putative [Entamoeba invadens IP1]|eukprot:XP_004259868.1 ankyrin repeat domain containing protein, putative [Entamoeba invadens IP1]
MESLKSPYSVGLFPTLYQRRIFPTSKPQQNGDIITPLHVSVFLNHPEFIESLINDYSINVNSQDSFGNTPLILAAQVGNMETTKILMSHTPSNSLTNQYGQTPILVALRFNHPEIALEIVKSIKNAFQILNTPDNCGYTVLHYAAFCNDEKVLSAIEQICFVDDIIENSINPTCSTPLHIAALNGSYVTLKWLLTKGANPNAENCMGQSPLLLAIKHKHIECINLLIEKTLLNVPDNYGQLALHYAAAVGCPVDIIQKLCDKYPDALNKMDANGNYPFHHAVKSNTLVLLQFFFKDGKLLKKRNSNGLTPIMLAVACGATTSFAFLIRLGDDTYGRSLSGTSVFMLACAYNQLEIARALFQEDPSVISDVDNNGNTAAHYAVQNNRVEVLKWIKSIACEIVKKPNVVGETPLHIACLCGYQQITEILLVFGLTMTDTTTMGRTPFHYCVLGGHLQLVKLLRRNAETGCFVGDKNKLTPLHYCCLYGMVHLMDDLLSACPVLLNSRDGCGRTPLHVAVVMNDALSVKKLLEHGADTTQIDIRKMSALQSSINRGYIHCYELIAKKESYTTIKKVKMVNDFLRDEDYFLRVKKDDIVNVFWEHKKGWALGMARGKYGIFPITRSIVVSLEKDELDKIAEILINKKMVEKGVDKKNRSASVATKEPEKKKFKAYSPVEPTEILANKQMQEVKKKQKTISKSKTPKEF